MTEPLPENGIEAMKQAYLLKSTIQQALRSLYGDRATPLFATFAGDMAKELQSRGVQLRKKSEATDGRQEDGQLRPPQARTAEEG